MLSVKSHNCLHFIYGFILCNQELKIIFVGYITNSKNICQKILSGFQCYLHEIELIKVKLYNKMFNPLFSKIYTIFKIV